MNWSGSMGSDVIAWDRLFEVAEHVLSSMGDRRSRLGVPLPYIPMLYGTRHWPAGLDAFDLWEVVEACNLLVRMGYLDNPGRPTAA
jgi:hypothetical protein